MSEDRRRQTLLTVLGISAGVATGVGVWLWRRGAGERTRPASRGWAPPRGSVEDIVRAYARDPGLSRRAIEVDAIAEGVIELSGRVRDRAESERATGIAQATTGVYTVVNRLTIEAEESAREATRRRWQEGAPDLRERHHYGMGVGMGTRRQSPSTDPDRPSDRQRRIERELDVRNVEADDDLSTPAADAESPVAHESVKPGDAEAIQDAGLTVEPGTPDAAEPGGVSVGEPAGGEEERE